MRIVQSFWTKPTFGQQSEGNDSRSLGGWRDYRYYYMSWALSCLRLKQFYDKVEIYTDELGAEILVDTMKLPYTGVSTHLEKIAQYGEFLWTLGKIAAYRAQTEPFIHIDGDIFLWKDLGARIHNAPLASQHLEDNQTYYRPVVDKVLEHFTLPAWLREELESADEILVSNTGIVGGHNLELIQEYTTLVFQLIDDNRDKLDLVNQGAFSVLCEQYLIYILSLKRKVPTTFLLEGKLDYRAHPNMVKVHKTPVQNQFIHPLSFYKRNPETEHFVEMSLRKEFPKMYYHIRALIAENKLPL